MDFIIGGDAEADAEASMLQAFSAAFLDVEYYKETNFFTLGIPANLEACPF